MTKRNTKTEEFELVEGAPGAPDVNESMVQDVEVKEVNPQEPASVELKTSETSGLKEKQTKEAIEATIQEKLSKRADGEVDPFVPSAQLQKEVKDIASQEGFALTRGTEAGAALMARARRSAQS